MAEQVVRQLKVTESDILGLILKNTKPSKYIILDIETGEFESNGAKKGYARLIVADSEEYGKLESVGLTSSAELVKFPISQYDGAELTGLVGKVLSAKNDEQWQFKKEKVDAGYGRSEYQIVGLTYRVTMQELATI